MKKYTILVEGGRSLVFTGECIRMSEPEKCTCYKDDRGSYYRIYKEHIVAIIEESV